MKRVGPALGFGLAAVALLAAALLLPGRLNPVEPQAEATVRAAAALLETHSMSGARVDWPKALSEALAMVEGTARRSALEGALEQLIRATGQRHTYYVDPDAYRKATQDAVADSASLGDVQRLAGGIVAVTVKGYRVLNEDVWQQDAQRLRGQIVAALAGGACGVRVDLTANTGGNLLPMLAALAPVLPAGPLGFSVDRAGQRIAFQRPALAPGQLSVQLPIAVVTGSRTGSSGEYLLTALRAADQVRTFGEATYGFTTGNVPFVLPNGYALLITTSELVDAKGQRLIGKIAPDEPVEGSGAALEAAAAWLKRQCAQRR